MSIASEITRISNAKTAIKDAIVAKGVEVADTVKLDGYAEKIAAIPTSGIEPKINPLDYLPDARRILREFDYSPYYTLTDPERECVIILFKDSKDLTRFQSLYSSYICCNGEFFFIDWNTSTRTIGENGKINWIVAKIRPNDWRDLIFSGSQPREQVLVYTMSDCVVKESDSAKSNTITFGDDGGVCVYSPSRVVYAPNAIIKSNGTDYQGKACRNTTFCKRLVLTAKGYGSAYREDNVLNCDELYLTFYNTATIQFNTRFWQHLPSVVDSKTSVRFTSYLAGTPYVSHKSTFAVFENGAIVGGMVLGWVANDTENVLTATFDNSMKAQYTDEEVAAIESLFHDKNWNIAWA